MTEILVRPGQNIQSVVNSCPNGSFIKLDSGVHTLTAPIDLSTKNALRIEGNGGVGYNEDDNWGTVIRWNFGGPAFVDRGVGVKHAGPKFLWLNLRPAHLHSVGWSIRCVNHVLIQNCSAKGPFRTVIDSDIPVSQVPNGDCAYNKAENLVVVNTQENAKGFLQGDGFWWLVDCNWDLAGMSPTAITNLRGSLSISRGKANHAGILFYSSGGGVDVIGMHFEQAPYTGAFMVRVEKGSNPLPNPGVQHKFLGNTFTPHIDAYEPGAKIAYFGPGTFGNNLPIPYNNVTMNKAGSFVNQGADGDSVFA